MLDHYFVASDGALHDTRDSDWASRPLRANYSRTVGRIESLADIKATLRAGPYAWPGSYPLFFLATDGDTLSFAAVRDEWSQIVSAHMGGDTWSGWHIAAVDVNWEDSDMRCAHTDEPIESAYADEGS